MKSGNYFRPKANPQGLPPGLINARLTTEAFGQLSGRLAGYPFVKVAVDLGAPESLESCSEKYQMNRSVPLREISSQRITVHFINHALYEFHSDYVAENVLKMPIIELDRNIDDFNRSVYLNPLRRFCFGTLALHQSPDLSVYSKESFFSLETVELDTMDGELVQVFYDAIRRFLDPKFPLLFKPANHLQEKTVADIDPFRLPRVFSHQIFSNAKFIALNPGSARGRLRVFSSEEDYRRAQSSRKTEIAWNDILVMNRIPEDIPRVAGIINAEQTTPLSHTNVLASGWKIPNCVALDIFEKIDRENLYDRWVEYRVEASGAEIHLSVIERPESASLRPRWSQTPVRLETPETLYTPIFDLETLRAKDRYRYGTKAANLGELSLVLREGSENLLEFYRRPRPSQPHLLGSLASFLGIWGDFSGEVSPQELKQLSRAAWEFLKSTLRIPRGIAIPFSIQSQFLESSPLIQQEIGKLKMALELGSIEVDAICVRIQNLIRATVISSNLKKYIESQITENLSGVKRFVIRSSSNAEDLENFSAAGIYESINHVTTSATILASIKEVWASLLSPRSVRLRQEVGISLDDCYMGVIVQEEIQSSLGGVLVTADPLNRLDDFRNVYVNVSQSVAQIVQGAVRPYQYLYNTVEGGGRTISIGDAQGDLDPATRDHLQKLAYAGRLLQSHFSPKTIDPVDIEWMSEGSGEQKTFSILQLRPYCG